MLIRLLSPKLENLYEPPSDLPLPILTIIYLAALTPPDCEVELIDERITEIPFDTTADLVGITVMSGSDTHAYEIAENYKKRGVPVVLGGFHTSLFPEEALRHADAIVIGEAENVWEVLLSNFKQGNLKTVYKNETPSDLKKLPLPHYDYYDLADYNNMMPFFITRAVPIIAATAP